MALKKRIIAKLLIAGEQLVKYKRFTESRRLAGNPMSTVSTLEDQCVDEFILCSLNTTDPDFIQKITENVFTPVTAAGGIHSLEQASVLIRNCGVDKIVTKSHELARKIADKFGNQAVVFAIDYNTHMVCSHPKEIGEVLLTDIDRDGMGKGFDLDVLKRRWDVPVVIAGGCGKLDHVKQAFANNADGVAISSMFFFSDKSPIKLRSWLVSEGCNVRDV